MHHKTYAESALYDLAFSYRDYGAEVSTLLEWYNVTTETQSSPKSVLELAAGPGRHTIEFSTRGIEAVALDLSPEMSSYCAAIAAEAKADVKVITADMVSFELPGQFDMILTLINSICHIVTEEDLLQHFKTVAGQLRVNGIYVIELTRSEVYIQPDNSEWSNESEVAKVEISWGWDRDYDYVEMRGEVEGRKVNLSDQFPMRRWQARELVDLASLVGLRLVGYSGEYEADCEGELGLKKLANETTMHSCLVFGG